MVAHKIDKLEDALAVYMRLNTKGGRTTAVAIVIVWSAAIAVALILAFAGSGWPPAAQLSAEAFLVTLYLLFWNSQKKRRQATWVVLSSSVIACGWLILFAATSR